MLMSVVLSFSQELTIITPYTIQLIFTNLVVAATEFIETEEGTV